MKVIKNGAQFLFVKIVTFIVKEYKIKENQNFYNI